MVIRTNDILHKEKKKSYSKEEILDKFTEYTIFSRYIGNFKIGAIYKSPLREDNNPSFGIFVNRITGRLNYKDLASGEGGNVFDFVKRFKKLSSFGETIRQMSQDLCMDVAPDVLERRVIYKPVAEKVISVTRKPFSERDLAYWNQFGISMETLKEYKVSPIRYYLVNKEVKMYYSEENPMYCYKVFNHFKIYRPLANKIEKWRGNLNSYDIMGYEQLPESGNELIITKSLKDVMVLRELGFTAVAPPSESTAIPKKVIDDLKRRFKRITVLYDRDRAGMQNARKLVKMYSLNHFFINKKYKVKDVSDFIKMYGISPTMEMMYQNL